MLIKISMGNLEVSLLSMQRKDMSDVVATHVEIPIFLICRAKGKVLKMNAGLKRDRTLCLQRTPTSAGLLPNPVPHLVQKGSYKVGFVEKPAEMQKEMMEDGGEISNGIFFVKID
jgi:hypothetical protein